jgi:hypothetical protein
MFGAYYQIMWTRTVVDFCMRALSPWTLEDPFLNINDIHIAGALAVAPYGYPCT